MSNGVPERAPTALEETRLLIPEKVRAGIRQAIMDAMAQGYKGQRIVQEVSMFILAELLAGNIQPDVAREARGYVEILLTSITAQALQEKEEDDSPLSVAKAIADARSKMGKVRPKYLLDDQGDHEVSLTIEMEEVKVER